jgi:hypothetical protein
MSFVLWTPFGVWLGFAAKAQPDPTVSPNVAYKGGKGSKGDFSNADFDFSGDLGVGIETDGKVDASDAKFH